MPVVAATIDLSRVAFFRDLNLTTPIWERGEDLYAGCLAFTGVGVERAFVIYKSTDAGETWSAQDFANSPPDSGNACFDGADTVYLGTVATGPITPPYNEIGLYSFDCASDTWSTIATGGPEAQRCAGIQLRSDDSVVILFDQGNPAGLDVGGSRLWGVIYSGGWGSAFDVGVSTGTGVSGGSAIFATVCSSQIDPDDRVHVAMFDFVYANFWYQAIEADGSLGSFHTFGDTLSTTDNTPPMGTVAICGDFVLIAASLTSSALILYIGDGIAGPTWSSATIDSVVSSGTPAVLFDPTLNAIGVMSVSDGAVFRGRLKLSISNSVGDPSTGYSAASTIYDGTLPADAEPGDQEVVQMMFSQTFLGWFYVGGTYLQVDVGALGFYIGKFQLTGFVRGNTFE